MSLRGAIERILLEWPKAREEQFAQHSLANFIRDEAADEVANSLIGTEGLSIKGSAGAGQWASVPWISVFDDVVTDSATRGYYVVYLFNADGSGVHLSLNQGTTATRAEFKDATRAVLHDRSALMRRRLDDFADRLPAPKIDLGVNAQLPLDYCAGHALGITYETKSLPVNEVIVADLREIIKAYKALTFRGGLDPSIELDVDELPSSSSSLTELRRYRMHRRIERNPKAAKQAKAFHGVRCQACELQFDEVYGQLGNGFIEAHHLRPIASLEEGVAVSYNVANDFAVLCSNCHRMIHRTADPADLDGFRKLLVTQG